MSARRATDWSHERRAAPMGPSRRPRPVHRSGRGAAPSRTRRQAADRRRPWRSHRAGCRLDRVVRGTRVRRRIGDAAADRREEGPRRGHPAGRCACLHRRFRRGHGHASRSARCVGTGARLGRGLHRDHHRRSRGVRTAPAERRARANRAALQRGDRRHPRPCEGRDGIRQAPRCLPSDGGQLAGSDGSTTDDRALGRRHQDLPSARGPRHPHRHRARARG